MPVWLSVAVTVVIVPILLVAAWLRYPVSRHWQGWVPVVLLALVVSSAIALVLALR